MPNAYPVYVVDDDPAVQGWVADVCEALDCDCTAFESGERFLAEADRLAPGCVLLDMRMPRMSGLQVQAEIAARGLPMAVVAMTGYGGVDVAVRSMKMGAVDFLEKPFSADDLIAACTATEAKLRAAGHEPRRR